MSFEAEYSLMKHLGLARLMVSPNMAKKLIAMGFDPERLEIVRTVRGTTNMQQPQTKGPRNRWGAVK